jgi:hypothetical protein
MVDVLVHANEGKLKLWAADVQLKKVAFGSLVHGGAQEKFIHTNMASKMKEKFREGYEHFGQVKTIGDAVAIILLFSHSRVMTNSLDPAGIIQCAERIIRRYPWMADRALNTSLDIFKTEIAKKEKRNPEPEPVAEVKENLFIITQSQHTDGWDLAI